MDKLTVDSCGIAFGDDFKAELIFIKISLKFQKNFTLLLKIFCVSSDIIYERILTGEVCAMCIGQRNSSQHSLNQRRKKSV